MTTNYEILYATSVGRVDTVITYMENMLDQGNFDWAHTIRATEMLKNALLEGEEQYIASALETREIKS